LQQERLTYFPQKKQEDGAKYKLAAEAADKGIFMSVCLMQATTKTAKKLTGNGFITH